MSVVDFDPQHHWNRPHPDDCDCGCRDDCGPDLNNIVDCWRQIGQLRRIIKDIIDDIGGPVKTGPIMGVVDGNAAKVGNVGEVLTSSNTGTFTSDTQTQSISALVVPPGDWDVTATCDLAATTGSTNGITGGEFALAPIPTGIKPMTASFYGMNNVAEVQMASQPTQVNLSNPTLLAFTLKTNDTSYSSATSDAGTYTFTMYARRMR
jgi:hypothetical protein